MLHFLLDSVIVMPGLPGSGIGGLTLLHGAAARNLNRSSEHSHTTLVLAFLNLLLIQTGADFKTLLMVLNGLTH